MVPNGMRIGNRRAMGWFSVGLSNIFATKGRIVDLGISILMNSLKHTPKYTIVYPCNLRFSACKNTLKLMSPQGQLPASRQSRKWRESSRVALAQEVLWGWGRMAKMQEECEEMEWRAAGSRCPNCLSPCDFESACSGASAAGLLRVNLPQ